MAPRAESEDENVKCKNEMEILSKRFSARACSTPFPLEMRELFLLRSLSLRLTPISLDSE